MPAFISEAPRQLRLKHHRPHPNSAYLWLWPGLGDERWVGGWVVYSGADRLLLLLMLRKLNGLIFISTKGMENSWPFQWYQLIPCESKSGIFKHRCSLFEFLRKAQASEKITELIIDQARGGKCYNFSGTSLVSVESRAPNRRAKNAIYQLTQ